MRKKKNGWCALHNISKKSSKLKPREEYSPIFIRFIAEPGYLYWHNIENLQPGGQNRTHLLSVSNILLSLVKIQGKRRNQRLGQRRHLTSQINPAFYCLTMGIFNTWVLAVNSQYRKHVESKGRTKTTFKKSN